MKKIYLIIIYLLIPVFIHAQYLEIRTHMNDVEYLEVQMRDTTNSGLLFITSEIVDLQFEIRWPQSLGADVDVEMICSYYDILDGLNSRNSEGSFYWRVFSCDPLLLNPPNNWTQNQWQTIAKFEVTKTAGSGSGSFAVTPDDWVVQGMNINIYGTDYDIHVFDSVINLNYPYPVYDHVWKGGESGAGYDENSWTNGSNWEMPCGQTYGVYQPPDTSTNCLIPGGLTFYPTNFNNSTKDSCRILRMQPYSLLEIPNGNTLKVCKNLHVENGALLDVKPGGKLEILGN